MCNLYSITTSQAAILAVSRVVNRYIGNLQPMPGVFSGACDLNTEAGTVMTLMRWGMPPPPKNGGPPCPTATARDNVDQSESPAIWVRKGLL